MGAGGFSKFSASGFLEHASRYITFLSLLTLHLRYKSRDEISFWGKDCNTLVLNLGLTRYLASNSFRRKSSHKSNQNSDLFSGVGWTRILRVLPRKLRITPDIPDFFLDSPDLKLHITCF